MLLWHHVKFQTVHDVPKEYFQQKKTIYAFCERIIDGDTIRVRHCRRNDNPRPLQTRGIAHITLCIRIYGVDTPEMAKFKITKSQPFAEEAKQFTSDLLLHKMVQITFLRKDQYGRAVCVVKTMPLFGNIFPWLPSFGVRDISMELARVGLAELYTGGGAEYNGVRDLFEFYIDRAKRKKRGIWSLGKHYVSAAEVKRNARGDMIVSNHRVKCSHSVPEPHQNSQSDTDSRPVILQPAVTGF